MKFRLATWNCFGMGQGLDAVTHMRAPFPERFRDPDLVAECSSPDILCIQELLSRDAQQFFDGLGPKHFVSRFRDDNRVRFGTSVTMRGSGLGIGTRAKLVTTEMRTFPGERVGWDRLARKGALYAQALIDETAIDVVTTHLQAGYDPIAVRVRAAQLAVLRLFIESVGSASRPFIVCGDFNIDGLAHARGSDEYRRLVGTLDDFEDLGADDDKPTLDPHPEGNALAFAFEPEAPPQRIDYVFWRPARSPEGPQVRVASIERAFDKPLRHTQLRNGKAGWASDHYGLSVTFEAVE